MNKIKIAAILMIFAFVGCQPENKVELSTDVITKSEQSEITPDKVIEGLKAGNERFVEGKLTAIDYNAQVKATSTGQYPEAIVLSCLDSRVPVEIIFDKGIGDIFVGRVAGNIENADMLGSFEFGTALAGSKVILVLGHSSCGAVKGAVDYDAVKDLEMENLNHLLANINPAVEASLKEGETRSSKNTELVKRSVEENVKLTIERIRAKSDKLKSLEDGGQIKIVGAVYDLKTGKVNWM
jgi:carbonic anhydrase